MHNLALSVDFLDYQWYRQKRSTSYRHHTPPSYTLKSSLTELANLTPSYRLSTQLRRRNSQLAYILDTLHDQNHTLIYQTLCKLNTKIEDCIHLTNSQLDVLQIVSPATRKYANSCLNTGGTTYKELREFAGLPPRPAFHTEDRLLKQLLAGATAAARKARENDLRARLTDEVKLAHANGYFFVFNTLTITDSNMEKVFTKKSKIFTNYIRNITRSVGKNLNLDKRQSDKQHNTLHRYFAVVEYGTMTGRRHIHILHLLKKLPYDSRDPNGTSGAPIKRQIESFRQFWQHGFSTPIAVRYSADDSFSRIGYRWPMEKTSKGYQPLKKSSIMAVANYVSKYITKQQGTKSWKLPNNNLTIWRTRMTRRFGMEWIIQRLQTISTKTLRRALQENKCRILHPLKSPAWSRLRKAALITLAQRNTLNHVFLNTRSAIPLCKRKRLSIAYLTRTLTYQSKNFTNSHHLRIDGAISKIVQATQLNYYSIDMIGSYGKK